MEDSRNSKRDTMKMEQRSTVCDLLGYNLRMDMVKLYFFCFLFYAVLVPTLILCKCRLLYNHMMLSALVDYFSYEIYRMQVNFPFQLTAAVVRLLNAKVS